MILRSLDMIVKVINEKRMIDGKDVWIGEEGQWKEKIEGEMVERNEEEVNEIEEEGRIEERENMVVDVNVIDVEESGEEIYKISMRERIRM